MTAGESFVFRDQREQVREGIANPIITGPVTDWATDFSHLDPRWAADPYSIFDELRERCPIAHTERFGGAWLPVRYEDVAAIAYDTERFSSRSVVLSNIRPPRDIAPVGGTPPISSDPPFHREARRILLPAFTRSAVEALRAATRDYCHSLIDAFEGRDLVDAAKEYAEHIPVRVIAAMLGFPEEDGQLFRDYIEDVFQGINSPPEEREVLLNDLFTYLYKQIEDHEKNPRDDLTSYLLNVEVNGNKLHPAHVAGTIALLLVAGIDTTWSAIGASLWHLAKTPADRERLVAEPELLPPRSRSSCAPTPPSPWPAW